MSDTMTTYETPLDRAKAIKDEFLAFAASRDHALPTISYAQIGDIVRDCESVIVSVGSLTPDALYEPVTCVSPRQATFLVEIIRSCATNFNTDGTTNHVITEAISEQGSADGQLLDDFARDLAGWSSKQPWSVVWSLAEAGLQVASLQITIGIP